MGINDRSVAAALVAVLEGLDDAVRAISLRQDGHLFSTVSYDNTTRLWNHDTDQTA